MSSNLKVNTVLPSVGTAIGIGTAGGSVSITSDTITALTGGSERLRITSAGKIGIGENTPLGKLHVKSSDSGATVGTSADELVLESSGNTGMTILSGTTGEGAINFGDSGDNNIGKIVYMHDGNYMYFKTSDTERLRITSTGQFLMGATSTSDANIKMLIQDSGTTILRVNNTDDGTATLVLGNTGSSNGAITQSGGHMTFSIANTERLRINSSGHTLPGSNNTYDLGSSSLRWRDIYTNDLHLSNQGSTNSVDNTWGDFTIQEGESDLFLINNRNGKKYKFNLTEVS